MSHRLAPKRQGDLGEADAIATLARLGAEICVPLFSSPDYDLVADFGDGLLRVQVKTSTHYRNGRYEVYVATRGGNQSWNGTVKYFDPARCDLLFALVGDGRRWLIPASAVEGRKAIKLGGPKYSEYEIALDPGHHLTRRSAALQCRSEWGSADVGESGGSVKSVPLA
jgi:hypothetical protein